jgi:hypothetical protein
MARALGFRHGSTELAFGLEKLDRKKLYGFVDSEVLDGTGRPCELAVLAPDGRTLVGRGGSALLMLDADGKYSPRDELRPVRETGEPVTRVPSSFDAPIALSTRASIDELLSHNIKSVYLLSAPMGAGELLAELKAGFIYTFPFSYRGGLDPDVGFLLANAEGAPFLLLGKPTQFQFVSLAQEAAADEETILDADEDSDDMDFAMM